MNESDPIVRVQELTFKLLDNALSNPEAEELQNLLTKNERARKLHLELMEQEAVLRGATKARDLAAPIMKRIHEELADRVTRGVMNKIHGCVQQSATRITPVGEEWKWLPRFKIALATAAIVLLTMTLVQSFRVFTRTPTPQETMLFGQWNLDPTARTGFRVLVTNGKTAEPITNAEVELELMDQTKNPVWYEQLLTSDNGVADFTTMLPANVNDGRYFLRVRTRSGMGQNTLTRSVRIRRSYKLLLTTDKPVYQPGQVMHLRALGLGVMNRHPAANKKLVLEVLDPRENKVFKRELMLSRFGLGSADFMLADQVNPGQYTVRAILNDTCSTRTVMVKRYVLPKFHVNLTLDKTFYRPGVMVTGELSAAYPFGLPVNAARVRLIAMFFLGDKTRPFAAVTGMTNAEGRFAFKFRLLDAYPGSNLAGRGARVTIKAMVTDTADHTEVKTRSINVTNDLIRIDLFPESGILVRGVPNRVYIMTSYPDGRPAKTRLRIGKNQQELVTSAAGIAFTEITPENNEFRITISAEDKQGNRNDLTRVLKVGSQHLCLLLRPDKAVYRVGQTARFTVFADSGNKRIFLDVIKAGQVVLMRKVDLRNGRGELALDLAHDLVGTLEVHAYQIMNKRDIQGDTRIIQVLDSDQLRIQASLDQKVYRPGEDAKLKLTVTRTDNSPALAALSLAGVDESVFALTRMRPGYENTFFNRQTQKLIPRYALSAHTQAYPLEASPLDPLTMPVREIEAQDAEIMAAARFAVPTEPTTMQRVAAKNYEERRKQVEQEQRDLARLIQAEALLLPAILFFILCLPMLVYGGGCLVRRTQMNDEEAAINLRERCDAINRWWLLGSFCAFFILLCGIGWSNGNGTASTIIIVISCMAGCSAFFGMRKVSRILRNISTDKCPPNLGACTTLLPWAMLSCTGTALIAAFFLAGHSVPVPRDISMSLITSMLSAAFLVSAAMMVAAWSIRMPATSRRSCCRSGWLKGIAITFASVTLLTTATIIKFGDNIRLMFFTSGVEMCGNDESLDNRMSAAAVEKGLDDLGDTGPSRTMSRDSEEQEEEFVKPEPAPLPRIRRYFPETMLWQPQLITDAKGHASLSVPLADSITTWRISMSAVSLTGELGGTSLPLRVFQDFFVDIDFPASLTRNDVISVPVAIYNYLDHTARITLKVSEQDWFTLEDSPEQTLRVEPRKAGVAYFTIRARTPGTHAFRVQAQGKGLADAVERRVRVMPDGRAVQQVFSGIVGSFTGSEDQAEQNIVIPENTIDNATDLQVKLYPGTFSQVVEGMGNIFRMPHGCFEQTSSTTYPNVLALSYLRATRQTKPELENKAKRLISLGYQRLLSFEVKGGGFEWFGHNPADLVLTAYGLMEFVDMSRVFNVDPQVIQHTSEWLLSQQEQDWTWQPVNNGYGYDGLNVGQQNTQTIRTTAYVTWALCHAGETGQRIERALDWLFMRIKANADPYTLALTANALIAGRRKTAATVLYFLHNKRREQAGLVHWSSAPGANDHGLTFSRGKSLAIATTALAAQAFLAADYKTVSAHKAMAWLIQQRDSAGTWHSTQATILAMRALLMGAEPTSAIKGPVRLRAGVDNRQAATVNITPATTDVYRTISLSSLVHKGANRVCINLKGKGRVAYQIVATYYVPKTRKPGSQPQPQKPLSIDVQYDTTRLRKNDIATAHVSIVNNRPVPAPMAIVDLGIPPGFTLLPASLQILKERKVIAKYEFTRARAILYFRELPSRRPIRFSVRMRARFPVKARIPSTRVYQYYEPEVNDTAPGVEVEVF